MQNKLLIIGNWKCNPKTLAEAKKLFNAVKTGTRQFEGEVIFAVPFIYVF